MIASDPATQCVFFVPGEPKPKGSMKAIMPRGARFPVVVHDSKKTKPWQADVKLFAAQAWKGSPASGPVSLSLKFAFVRPKSISEKKRPNHVVKPDLDKLVRCVKDGLRGVVYVDDAQVVSLSASKFYADKPGVLVAITAAETKEA